MIDFPQPLERASLWLVPRQVVSISFGACEPRFSPWPPERGGAVHSARRMTGTERRSA